PDTTQRLVVELALLSRHPRSEEALCLYGRADQGRVYPVVGIRVERVVTASGGVEALHVGVHLEQASPFGGRGFLAAVDDGAQGQQGAPEPSPRVGPEIAMVVHPGPHRGVGHLQEQKLRGHEGGTHVAEVPPGVSTASWRSHVYFGGPGRGHDRPFRFLPVSDVCVFLVGALTRGSTHLVEG